jgi:hypothetical protein
VATWQIFIPLLQVHQNWGTLFIMPLIIKVFLVVNGVVAINFCNPQMLQYVIRHLFIMQVDARNMFQGKNKRFIYHNKDYGTSSLKKTHL